MKNIQVVKSIALAMIAMIAIPALALADNNPTFSIIGVNGITQTRAIVSVSFHSESNRYGTAGEPKIYIEYTNEKTGATNVSAYSTQFSTSNIDDFWLYDLDANTDYSYRAVMIYDGDRIRTAQKSFKTSGASVTTVNNDNDVVYTPATAVNDATSNIPSIWTIFGGSTTNTTTTTNTTNTSAIKTGGGITKNGVGLAITDNQARVEYGDHIDFVITYQNTKATSLQNAEIAVLLPEQYEFVRSTTDVDYNAQSNIVSFMAGRVAPHTTKTFTFTARAIGAGNDEVKTVVTMDYDGGSLTTSDRDAYYGRETRSVLGASVFGAGFFPQTFLGWFVVVVLIAVIIIVARRYTTVPAVPEQEQPKTA